MYEDAIFLNCSVKNTCFFQNLFRGGERGLKLPFDFKNALLDFFENYLVKTTFFSKSIGKNGSKSSLF